MYSSFELWHNEDLVCEPNALRLRTVHYKRRTRAFVSSGILFSQQIYRISKRMDEGRQHSSNSWMHSLRLQVRWLAATYKTNSVAVEIDINLVIILQGT
jgi:hypothetical protein